MRTLGKGVKTRGGRVVGGNGFFLDEALHGAWDLGKKAKELHNKNEADRAVKEEAWNKRMAEIEANSPFKKQYGQGIFGDLFEDLAVEGGKKLYKFDKEHGSHLKSGLQSGLRNMFLNTLKGGNGVESVLRYGRGHMGMGVLDDLAKQFKHPQNRFAVLPDVMPEYDKSDNISGWIEKERRDTGYYGKYGRPAILGEGM
jgi:hypothetical protein